MNQHETGAFLKKHETSRNHEKSQKITNEKAMIFSLVRAPQGLTGLKGNSKKTFTGGGCVLTP